MSKRHAVIFDIDGVLVDNTERLKFIRQDPPDWKQYHSVLMSDKPIKVMLRLTRALLYLKYSVFLNTARPESTRDATISQLDLHGAAYDHLMMRKDEDNSPSHVVKLEMLKHIMVVHRCKVVLAVEDNPKTVAMYRMYGVLCLAADPGNWETFVNEIPHNG